MRIVSLLPGATEICFALGLGDQVVGVSHECDYPAAARALPSLTRARLDPHGSSRAIDAEVRDLAGKGLSIYEVDEERLRELRPDVIITQDTCEVCAVPLAQVQASVRKLVGRQSLEIVSLAPMRLGDVWDTIEQVGHATASHERASELTENLRERIRKLAERTAGDRPRVLALEWLDPPMVAGHWTPELIQAAGGEPVLAHDGAPTRSEDWQRIASSRPDVVLLMPCGFPIAQTARELGTLMQREEFRTLQAVDEGRVWIIDGNALFNRPGPRLADSAEIAAAAIDPDRFDPPDESLAILAPAPQR